MVLFEIDRSGGYKNPLRTDTGTSLIDLLISLIDLKIFKLEINLFILVTFISAWILVFY